MQLLGTANNGFLDLERVEKEEIIYLERLLLPN
jgi:hypothetical protein